MFPKMRIKNLGGGIYLRPEQQLLARFLDAVMTNSDEVWAFVSKVYSARLDLNELRELLGAGAKIKVSKAVYMNAPKNIRTDTIYLENPEINLKRLLHLRMVKDNGAWKIYGVEHENA